MKLNKTTLLSGLILFIAGCGSELSPLNPILNAPPPVVVVLPGVSFEDFDNGAISNPSTWAAASDSSASAVSSAQAHTGINSLKNTISIGTAGWGVVGFNMQSHLGVIDATGFTNMSFWINTSADLKVVPRWFEGPGGDSECWKASTAVAVTSAGGWQKIMVPIATMVAHVSGSCVVAAGIKNINSIKTVEFEFSPATAGGTVSAVVYIDDIRFE